MGGGGERPCFNPRSLGLRVGAGLGVSGPSDQPRPGADGPRVRATDPAWPVTRRRSRRHRCKSTPPGTPGPSQTRPPPRRRTRWRRRLSAPAIRSKEIPKSKTPESLQSGEQSGSPSQSWSTASSQTSSAPGWTAGSSSSQSGPAPPPQESTSSAQAGPAATGCPGMCASGPRGHRAPPRPTTPAPGPDALAGVGRGPGKASLPRARSRRGMVSEQIRAAPLRTRAQAEGRCPCPCPAGASGPRAVAHQGPGPGTGSGTYPSSGGLPEDG